MEQTTQSPPAKVEKAGVDKPATPTKPLPATEEDFHARPSRTQSSGFRIAVVIAVIVLLVAGFFAYRYFTSYESTDDAQVDGHVNSVSAARRRPCHQTQRSGQSIRAGGNGAG